VVASTDTFPRDGELDLRRLFATLWTGRLLIAVCVLATTLTFAVAAFIITPIYRATTVLVPVSPERAGMGLLGPSAGSLGGLASLVGVNLGGDNSHVEEALAVLHSREFNEAFIRDNGLMPILYASRWDAANLRWRGEPEDWPTLWKAYRYFTRRVVAVSRDRETGLVALRVDWKNPQLAAKWANDLVARLNSEMRGRAIKRTNASVGYLRTELADTVAIDTRETINRLMAAEINQRMFANVTEEYALRVVDRALVPDLKDKVRPKRALMLVLGCVLGASLGALLLMTGDAFGIRRRAQRAA
jgi:uncharacterized protein involved in exopolysaccharide biosynthesis